MGRAYASVSQRHVLYRQTGGWGADGRTVKWTDRSIDYIHSLYGFVFM